MSDSNIDKLVTETELEELGSSELLTAFVKAIRRLKEIDAQVIRANMNHARIASALSRRMVDVMNSDQIIVHDGFAIYLNDYDSLIPSVYEVTKLPE